MVMAGKAANAMGHALFSKRTKNIEAQKPSDNPFASALTAADLIVEDMIGAHILANFEDVSFLGEEKDKDRISQFFPANAPYTVTLDPINGTLFFKDGLWIYDIILTICEGTKILAAVDYVPVKDKFYIGIRDAGAFTLGTNDVIYGLRWGQLDIRDKLNKLVVTQHVTEAQLDRLQKEGLDVRDLDWYARGDEETKKHWQQTAWNVLSGSACAISKPRASLHDWGAIGFIAAEAGGYWNDPTFDPITLRSTTPLVAAATPEEYDTLTKIFLAE